MMQRFLVILVVLLVGAVCGLGFWVLDLSDRVNVRPAVRRGGGSTVIADPAQAQRVASLETKIDGLLGQLDALRKDNESVRREARSAAARATAVAAGIGSKAASSADGEAIELPAAAGLAARSGDFAFTEQDEDYFMALEERVQRRRRIANSTRNLMSRMDALARRGDIGEVPAEKRPQIETQMAAYATAAEDLVQRFLRNPDPATAELGYRERREALGAERDTLAQSVRVELEALVGTADAAIIADKTLKNVWGRATRRGNRRNANRGR